MSEEMANKSMSSAKKLPTWAKLAIGLVVVLVVISLISGYVVTGREAFLASYSGLGKQYTKLQGSFHKDIECEGCHSEASGVTYRAALIGDFYLGLVKKPSEPVFAKFEKPTNEACSSCHKEDWSMRAVRTVKIPHPAHLRVADETRQCVKCHKWTAHEEEYMKKHKKMVYSSVCAAYGCHVGTKQPEQCDDCHHSLKKSLVAWRGQHPKSVATQGPNSCLEACHDANECRMCHTTGVRPKFKEARTAKGLQDMEKAHVQDDWMAKHGSVALKDESKCLECHVSVGECEECHSERPAFHGLKSTWLGRHKPLAKNKARCMACHPDEQWCEKCHKQFKEMQ